MLAEFRSVSFRYRVGWVLSIIPDEDRRGGGVMSLYDVREFRTLKAAQRYRDRLARGGRLEPGRRAVLQVGVVQWLPHDEAQELMRRLVEGVAPLPIE